VNAVLAVIVPGAVAAALILALSRSPLARRLLDRPNERSLHTVPTPRIGGIAIVLSAFPWGFAHGATSLAWIFSCAAALAVLSFIDDIRSLPVGVRLAAHLAAAGVVVAPLGLALAAAIVVAVAIAWMANLFNFMDGADGLAGGMAAIGFAAYAIAAQLAGEQPLAIACTALASAALGFLAFNFPPARVFMGDAGSVPLGFLAGALGLAGYARGAWPAWFPVLVFSPFVVDASVTLLRRAFRGERLWRAHRGHYYQRLVLAGWTARRVALAEYAVMAAATGAALAGRGAGLMLQCGIISAAALLYALLILAIEAHLPPAGGAFPRRN